MEKHPQAELIKQVVDGLGEPQYFYQGAWFDGTLSRLVHEPNAFPWRIKPAEPEKSNLSTKMNAEELTVIYCKKPGFSASLMNVANAALRHAVDNGYLVLPEKKEG